MKSRTVRSPKLRPPARLLAGVVLATVILTLQILSGAYHAEFGSDEASHYISGLLLHDYMLSGFTVSPLAYLIVFHSHYPLVGIGHWPPFYYWIESIWMLLFGVGRTPVLILSGSVTWGLGLLVYNILARRSGPVLAGVAAIILVTSPITQSGTDALMLDVPVGLLCLLSMLAYVRYLDTLHYRWSAAFSILASVAIMTKGNGACLALLPVCAILIGRRWDLPRRPSFWLPALIVGGLTGPWYVLTYGKVAAGFRYTWGLDYLQAATIANAHSLFLSVGPVVVLLGIVGFAAAIDRPSTDNLLVGAASLLASVWIFQSVAPAAIEARYIEPMLPPLLILAVSGSSLFIDARSWASPALLGISFLAASATLIVKPATGIIQAVQQLVAHPIDQNQAVLIAADAEQEAASVAEIAMHDHHRPHLFAIRGSRLLGEGGYNNQDYQPRFANAEAAMAAIDAYAIPIVLLRTEGGPGQWTHLRQIEQARTLYPDRWQRVGQSYVAATPVLLFQILGNAARPVSEAKLMTLTAPLGLRAASAISAAAGR